MNESQTNKINSIGLFLDSGAFSAWTKKEEINIVEYTDCALQNEHMFDAIANLDVIPGTPGVSPTKAEIEHSAEKGWANYEYMLSRGVPKEKLIHAFHMGEDFKWLERMVEEMPYIAFGGFAKGSSTPEKTAWLDECMNYVIDEHGMPKVKFHGFGVTSYDLLWRYPWYSVDSTAWLVYGIYGAVAIPYYRDGKWCYDESPWRIGVSDRSPGKAEAGVHIDSIPPRQRQLVLDYIEEKGFRLGKSSYKMVDQTYVLAENEAWVAAKPEDEAAKREVEIIEEEGLCNSYQLRGELNILFFVDLQARLPAWPWPYVKSSIPRLI